MIIDQWRDWLQACVKLLDIIAIICCNFHKSDRPVSFSNLLCINSINMVKVVIKILQRSALTKTEFGGLLHFLMLQIFCSVRLPKTVKSYCKNKKGSFFGPECSLDGT